MKYGKIISFVGGLLMGTAGVAILSSKDAKKAYTHAAAAGLRGKDSIMKTAATVKENCGDIYSDAKDINDRRYDEQEKAEVEKAKAITGVLTPSSSALLHNGSTIMTGVKSTTRLIDKKNN